jgi:hypothetical protein
MSAHKEGFRAWLLRQVHREDEIGAFARKQADGADVSPADEDVLLAAYREFREPKVSVP